MTVTTGRQATSRIGPTTGPAGLTFNRTVDRCLLHRYALSEVFLTDSHRTGERDYAAAAQLPPFHAHYTDHPGGAAYIDPMLLLECARQAETYGGHVYFDVPTDTHFILRRWSMDIQAPRDLRRPIGPSELRLPVHTHTARVVDDRLRALTYDVGLVLAERQVGTVQIQVAYLPPEAYRQIRAQRRGDSTVPTSADLVTGRVRATTPPRRPVDPARVGRGTPSNVVLYEPVATAGQLSATIRVPVDNPSMFDHPQDHLPGMVMMEAARQLGLLALGGHGVAPDEAVLTGVRAQFANYAELDRMTTVRLTALPRQVPDRGHAPTMSVVFEQRDEVIARAGLTFGIQRGDREVRG